MAKQPSIQEVLEIAYSQVGYIEKPVNITKYGRYFKSNPAQWCGLFIMWVMAKAGYDDFPNTAYTPNGVKEWKKRGLWKTSGEVKPASIVYFDFKGDGVNRVSHVGIAVLHLANNQVLCIEGNTSTDNRKDQRNGGEVCIRMRHPNDIVGWAEPEYGAGWHPIVAEINQALHHGIKPYQETDPEELAETKPVAKKAAKKVAKK
jgi:hypothetical protein